jgi:RNA polymerase sigma-70 factor (ECF subfamily)
VGLTGDATAALVLRAKAGDVQAFDALARAYLRAAYSVALAVVGRAADAEDVAQDALVLALERIDSCREPARFGGWLLAIVRNQALNWLDRRKLRDVPANEPPPAATAPPTRDSLLADRLLHALSGLSPVAREVVLLHDLEGFTHGEIAETLGISEVMCRQHLFRARQELRAELGEGKESLGG